VKSAKLWKKSEQSCKLKCDGQETAAIMLIKIWLYLATTWKHDMSDWDIYCTRAVKGVSEKTTHCNIKTIIKFGLYLPCPCWKMNEEMRKATG